MTKTISFLFCALFFCGTSQAQKVSELDLEKSIIKWQGSHLFSFGKHYGTVKLKEGKLHYTNNMLSGGIFQIDMNTIINTDGKYNESLVNHLKDPDFFDVLKFPLAELRIINVEKIDEPNKLNITADLTIKDTTLPINFRAEVDPSNKNHITAKFIINRARWKLNYSSRSITNVQDNIISDAIEFEVLLFTKLLK